MIHTHNYHCHKSTCIWSMASLYNTNVFSWTISTNYYYYFTNTITVIFCYFYSVVVCIIIEGLLLIVVLIWHHHHHHQFPPPPPKLPVIMVALFLPSSKTFSTLPSNNIYFKLFTNGIISSFLVPSAWNCVSISVLVYQHDKCVVGSYTFNNIVMLLLCMW